MTGRKIGSYVRLTPFARKLYPQDANKLGTITKRVILTHGNGLAYFVKARYQVSYFVRWQGEDRDYLYSSRWLQTMYV